MLFYKYVDSKVNVLAQSDFDICSCSSNITQ